MFRCKKKELEISNFQINFTIINSRIIYMYKGIHDTFYFNKFYRNSMNHDVS